MAWTATPAAIQPTNREWHSVPPSDPFADPLVAAGANCHRFDRRRRRKTNGSSRIVGGSSDEFYWVSRTHSTVALIRHSTFHSSCRFEAPTAIWLSPASRQGAGRVWTSSREAPTAVDPNSRWQRFLALAHGSNAYQGMNRSEDEKALPWGRCGSQ
jgi:hypothetical protein